MTKKGANLKSPTIIAVRLEINSAELSLKAARSQAALLNDNRTFNCNSLFALATSMLRSDEISPE